MTEHQPVGTKVETPGLKYTFYNEDNADMTTPEGRLAWFCAHFEVEPPALSYDLEKPDALLLTDELCQFLRREGVSLDWFISGKLAGPLKVYREKYRIDPDTEKFLALFGMLDDCEQAIFAKGLRRTAEGADLDDAMKDVRAEIEAYRA